jgi:diacylglycerol kinase (ATP)
MRHKFLGTGDAGYHPLRKIQTVFSGLRYAVLYDGSITWKLMASALRSSSGSSCSASN